MTIRAVLTDGQLKFDEPPPWPEGTIVEVSPVDDDERPRTAEEIAHTLELMSRVTPFELTEQERDSIERDKSERKEWEKRTFFERAEKIDKLWE